MVKQFWRLAVLIGLTLVLTVEGPTASAQGAGEKTIHLTSGYQAKGLFRDARQVGLSATLDGKGGGKGVLTLNPNAVEGYRSTLLPIERVKITFEATRESGRAEKGRQLYRVKGEGLGQLLLDAPVDGKGPYWLIRVDQEGKSQRLRMAAPVPVSPPNPAAAEEAGTKLSLTTAYLYAKVIGGHWLRLNVTLDDKGGKGRLEIDPNYPVYNEFGDPMGLTEIAPQLVDITLETVQLDDPATKGRRLYEIKGKDVKSRLFLVVWPKAGGPHRLIVHGAEKRVSVFPLHTARVKPKE